MLPLVLPLALAHSPTAGFIAHQVVRSALVSMSTVEPAPPAGFEWGVSLEATSTPLPAEATAPAPEQTAVEEPPPLVVPTVVAAKPKSSRKVTQRGIFAPLVLGAKKVMGTDELNKLRADVIV